MIERPVLVTTAHRGVFFGYTKLSDAELDAAETIRLSRARNCLYWPIGNRGFVGLASDGPAKDARVGPAANIGLRNITAVANCTPEAAKAWEAAPWAK